MRVPGHSACLAHLPEDARRAHLDTFGPGDDVDVRGTPFTEELLGALLRRFRKPNAKYETFELGRAHFGEATFVDQAGFTGVTFCDDARFGGATFADYAEFSRATFSRHARFDKATFSSDAGFARATFSRYAGFDGATFSGDATFDDATFSGYASFARATFTGDARFDGATFSSAWFRGARFTGEGAFNRTTFARRAWFSAAEFSGAAEFDATTFNGEAKIEAATFTRDVNFIEATFASGADFKEATFSATAWFDGVMFNEYADFSGARFAASAAFGPLVCAGVMRLTTAVFEVPATLDVAAARLECVRTRWASTATLRLRHAVVDLSDAVFSAPTAVTAHPVPFEHGDQMLDEWSLTVATPGKVRMASLRGVDAAHLVLTDIDLSACRFSGAFHLDQLRLSGDCTFAPVSAGWQRSHRLWPYRLTRRRTLAEEHHWRTSMSTPPGIWLSGPDALDPQLTPGPASVAAMYRQLRKAFEDGKDQPGAADFYYGEMEMRRHDRDATPAAERSLLWAYWLISGYGLRAWRALAALGLVIAAATIIFATTGFAHSATVVYRPVGVPAGRRAGRRGPDSAGVSEDRHPRRTAGLGHCLLPRGRLLHLAAPQSR